MAEGKLLLVTGPVGCGKSSLLLALLEELPPSTGKVTRNGKIVYVPQTAWAYSGTLRENILFNQAFDQEKYDRTIEACDLKKDIAMLPEGDKTLLGERGASLSGGQRARVNLARAVYSDADIYLLDDPLSAVDAKVGKHIFENCINGLLSNKVRVLVTHQLQYMKSADYIVILDKGGVVKQGAYQQMKESGMDIDSLEKEFHLGQEKYHEIEGGKMTVTTDQVFSELFKEFSYNTGRSNAWELFSEDRVLKSNAEKKKKKTDKMFCISFAGKRQAQRTSRKRLLSFVRRKGYDYFSRGPYCWHHIFTPLLGLLQIGPAWSALVISAIAFLHCSR